MESRTSGDNFSKAILGWNVSLKKDGENAKAALQNAVESIQKQYPDLQTASLITDGGGENHNMLVEDFLTNIEAPEIIKLLALKEVKFSNSRSEEHTSELQSRPHLVCRLLL